MGSTRRSSNIEAALIYLTDSIPKLVFEDLNKKYRQASQQVTSEISARQFQTINFTKLKVLASNES